MACPFFHATQRLSDRQETRPMPLGDVYAGECHAQAVAYRPNEVQLRSLCNLGYARDACPRFPKDAACDAVRFSISREETVDEKLRFTISYVEERDHRPGEHGRLEYQAAEQRFVKPHANQILNRLAEAYAEAYLRRRAQAGRPALRAAS